MVWAAQSLQFVIFCQPKFGLPDALQPWLQLFGSSPENFQRTNPASPQEQSLAIGAVGDFNFMIGATQGRFDLILSAGDDVVITGGSPFVSNVEPALDLLEVYAKEFLKFQPATRLAIVAQLLEETESESQATELFKQHINADNIPPGAIDLSLQVNVRKQAAERCMLNRLCRWHTQSHQLMLVNMASPSGPAPHSSKTLYGAGVLIDVNTLPTSDEFEQGRAVETLQVIVSEVKQIMSGGYGYVVG